MVIVEQNGPWLRVFANTDVQQNRSADAPVFGGDAATPPISGWLQSKGIVSANTPNADNILFGAAAGQEAKASDVHGSRAAAQAARLLYARDAQLFPEGPHGGEAAWRAADIRWQLEKADVYSRPSAHEKEAYLRQQIDESEMKKVIKHFPGSKYADLAALRHAGQQSLWRLAGLDQVPGEGSGNLIRNTQTSTPIRPKRPRRSLNRSTGLRQRATSTRATTTTRKPPRIATTPRSSPLACSRSTPHSDYSAPRGHSDIPDGAVHPHLRRGARLALPSRSRQVVAAARISA